MSEAESRPIPSAIGQLDLPLTVSIYTHINLGGERWTRAYEVPPWELSKMEPIPPDVSRPIARDALAHWLEDHPREARGDKTHVLVSMGFEVDPSRWVYGTITAFKDARKMEGVIK
jgi:hypothetical protein